MVGPELSPLPIGQVDLLVIVLVSGDSQITPVSLRNSILNSCQVPVETLGVAWPIGMFPFPWTLVRIQPGSLGSAAEFQRMGGHAEGYKCS